MKESERYFEGSDNSGHHYIVPWSKRKEWSQWNELPEDDEASWDVPEWAERIDGGTLTFADPRVER